MKLEKTAGFWTLIIILSSLVFIMGWFVFVRKDSGWLLPSAITGGCAFITAYYLYNKPYPTDLVAALKYVQEKTFQRPVNMQNKEVDRVGRMWYVHFPKENPPTTVKVEENDDGQFVPCGIIHKKLWEIMSEMNDMKIKELEARESILGTTIVKHFEEREKNGEGNVKI